MRIKYGELPKREVLQKLLSVSFNTPRKNLEVYKFCDTLTMHINYMENERLKLIKKYGDLDNNDPTLYRIKPNTEEMKMFFQEWNPLIEMEIDEDITPLPLSEDDFSDNCSYMQEKENWLNGMEIATVLRFCE